MTKYQVLTDESIEKIEGAITIIEDVIRFGVADDELYYEAIADLKGIIADVKNN